ncbi:synaptotagmin-A-like [Protopterus annectens]|uniref:synaptotagmin-A-like n=1 Tax=Protopterus annectens TaxID=7888 RepID=UPI001CFB7076|nr:synaptotagmin-A-like [Protopterus annectens]XP_043915752.1 synaptotagmin-A-like [Protopterus annectens]
MANGEFWIVYQFLHWPISNELKFGFLAAAILLFIVTAVILGWQIYLYCKLKMDLQFSGHTKLGNADNGDYKDGSTVKEKQSLSYSTAVKLEKEPEKKGEESEMVRGTLSPSPSSSENESFEILEVDTKAEQEESSIGQLRFSLLYDKACTELVLTIIEATDLPGRDFSQSADPFVRVRLLLEPPSQQSNIRYILHEWQTKVVRNTKNPVFGDRFSCSIKKNQLKRIIIKLEVKDFDKYSRHRALGEVRLLLGDLDISETVEFSERLKKIQKDIVGEVLLSLKYLPTAQKIEVGLLKVKTACPRNNDKDIYASITLYCNHKRQKHQKSSLKAKSDVTIYNETFLYHLSDPYFQQCEVTVSIYETYNKKGSGRHLIGKACLGNREAGDGTHWNLMMSCVRQPIAKWHPLLI